MQVMTPLAEQKERIASCVILRSRCHYALAADPSEFVDGL